MSTRIAHQVFPVPNVLQARAGTGGTFGEWTKHALVVNAQPFHLRNFKKVLVVNAHAFLFRDVAGLRLRLCQFSYLEGVQRACTWDTHNILLRE